MSAIRRAPRRVSEDETWDSPFLRSLERIRRSLRKAGMVIS